MDDVILVGTFGPENGLDETMMFERRWLMDRFEDLDIDYLPVEFKDSVLAWPRDYFMCHNGEIYKRENYGFYADGGYILNSDELTLACSDVSFSECGCVDTPEQRLGLLKKLYPGEIFILPPPDQNLNLTLSPHIDLVVLPIFEQGVLFADKTYYYKTAKREIDSLCSKYSLNLELTRNDYSKPSYPCNSLVLRREGRLFVFTNSVDNKDFISRLGDYGINVVDVSFSTNCAFAGSVHCVTNTLPRTEIGHLDDLLNV